MYRPRARFIHPGFLMNEALHDLGDTAKLLFQGLWMIADREGRLEDRPRAIKATIFPYKTDADLACGIPVENYDLACGNPVENPTEYWLQKLAEGGFIHRYESNGLQCMQISAWNEYQRPHPREEKSIIPPMPEKAVKPKRSASSKGQPKANLRQTQGQAQDRPICVKSNPNPNPNPKSDGRLSGGLGGAAAVPDPETETESPEPDPPEPPPGPQPQAARRSPALMRKGPLANGSPGDKRPVDLWPHKPEDVALVRGGLDELAEIFRMPKADDRILRQVLDCSRGAPGAQVYQALRDSYLRRKFDQIHSWALIPLVLGDWFKAA